MTTGIQPLFSAIRMVREVTDIAFWRFLRTLNLHSRARVKRLAEDMAEHRRLTLDEAAAKLRDEMERELRHGS